MHAAVADALPVDDVDRRAWHLSESLWAPDAGVAEMLDSAAARAVQPVRLRGRVHGLRAGRPAEPRRRRPGRPAGGRRRERVGRRPRTSGDRAAGRAAPDRARAGADDQCTRAARVHRRAQRLGARGGRAARAGGRLDHRSPTSARSCSPRRCTPRSSSPTEQRRAGWSTSLTVGGGGDDVDAVARHRDRRGRDGQGAGGPRWHRGAARRRTPPGGQLGAAGGRPRGVLADVRPAVHPRRRDRAASSAPGSTRRGRGPGWARCPGCSSWWRATGRRRTRGRGPRRDYTEAIRLARDTGQTTELAMSLAGSVLAGVADRSGGGVPGARRGGARPVRQS